MLGQLGEIGHFILTPLYYGVSGVLLAWHSAWSLIMPADGGLSWALSIIGLTLTIRVLLIPLFVKQIKSSRNMQLIQPKVKELQKKYGHDRERLAAETMKLYKETGTNPFASCLPLLLQMPIFLALFRLVDHAAKQNQGNGFLTGDRVTSFGKAEIFGLLPIKASFTNPSGDVSVVRVVAALMVVLMTATTFLTQRQLMSKNMPTDALSGPYAQQQKMLLYVLPVVFAVGGIAFPIAVLFYWTTSNLWTMGQQFYVIRNNPAPGTPAFKAKQERDARKKSGEPEEGAALAAAGGVIAADPTDGPASGAQDGAAIDRRSPQRQQPKRQSKSQRKSGSPARPAAPTKTNTPKANASKASSNGANQSRASKADQNRNGNR